MKVLCEFCSMEAASLFCFADEVALCNSCDHKIHHANKVASKHCRFSFLHPSSHQPSLLCDICQKKRAFVFCKDDRAILCGECDLRIHTTSDLTRQHARYLLTGVQLSSAPISSTPMIVEEKDEEVGEGSLYSVYSRDDAGVSVLTETDSNVNSNNTQYFINAKSQWQVEEIMFNNGATTSTDPAIIAPMSISSSQYYQQGEMNDDASHEGFPFWISQQRQFFYSKD